MFSLNKPKVQAEGWKVALVAGCNFWSVAEGDCASCGRAEEELTVPVLEVSDTVPLLKVPVPVPLLEVPLPLLEFSVPVPVLQVPVPVPLTRELQHHGLPRLLHEPIDGLDR